MAKRERNTTLFLKEVRKIINRPKGWVKGTFHKVLPDRTYDAFCLIGAINKTDEQISGKIKPSYSTTGTDYYYSPGAKKARQLLDRAVKNTEVDGSIPHFNDHGKTRKKDILSVIDEAIALSEK